MTTETPVTSQDTPDAGVQQTADGIAPDAQSAAPADTSQTGDAQASDAAKADAPEIVYEFAAPEGVELDKTSTEEFVAIAKELKLPKEAAQKVVDLAIKREQARAEAFAKQAQDWEASVKADKELGGDKLPETLAICRKAIDLGPPELKELLSSTKMGSHPAVVKWAYAVGKALSEDKFVSSGSGAPRGGKDIAKSLYPNQS
jgi:hypothetical protein